MLSGNYTRFGRLVGTGGFIMTDVTPCNKPVPGTNLVCGDVRGRYCSDECSTIAGAAELEELGITSEMLSEALANYYECKEMIERKERADLPSRSHDSSDPT
jgi:hypothetical protein